MMSMGDDDSHDDLVSDGLLRRSFCVASVLRRSLAGRRNENHLITMCSHPSHSLRKRHHVRALMQWGLWQKRTREEDRM